ncbi:MAG: hypothetical protein ACTSVI_06560 [Promethearchaeota archaeon]
MVDIYRIEKGELKKIDKLIFSTGDSYLLDDGNNIWLWHGMNASVDEKGSAAALAKKIDEERGKESRVITIDQGDTTENAIKFKKICAELGGLKIMDKNIAESFLTHFEKEKTPPILFKISGEEVGGDINAMEYIQVERKKENLDPDDVMLLFVPDEDKTYVWIGSGASVKEKVKGGQVARQFDKDMPGVQDEIFINEGEEPEEFWKYF